MNPHKVEKILDNRKNKLNRERELKIKKHFGSLKRGIDGLEYQLKLRI